MVLVLLSKTQAIVVLTHARENDWPNGVSAAELRSVV